MTGWTLFTDGASRGNPGEAGAGAYLVNGAGEEIGLRRYLGRATNNQAEYAALLLCLKKLVAMGVKQVSIKADSQLMIRQLEGLYKVKSEDLLPLFLEAKQLLGNFEKVKVAHIPREENKKADQLANEAIDFNDDLSE